MCSVARHRVVLLTICVCTFMQGGVRATENSTQAVTTTTASTTTTAAPYYPRHDELCTNECSLYIGDSIDTITGPRKWCGQVKEDVTGRLMRCVQYTKHGETCVDECGYSSYKGYHWCLTNRYQLEEEDWWGSCSAKPGHTTGKNKCSDECARRGENYFWCHTSGNNWEYCSPPGLVKPVQFTVRGSPCISECRQGGKNYHWCYKNLAYCDEESCDDNWDYCSLDEEHTRYNYKCDGPCAREGKSYYWCTQGDSWDYCSPKPKIGVHFKDHVEVTIKGSRCRDICAKYGEKYFWCDVWGASTYTWDYCSPVLTIEGKRHYTTKGGEPCQDACASRGKSYFWCKTKTSWDYCSPVFGQHHAGVGAVGAHPAILATVILAFWAST